MPDQTPETRCPGCDGPPGPSPMAECIDPFHNRHPAPPDLEAAVERCAEMDSGTNCEGKGHDGGHTWRPTNEEQEATRGRGDGSYRKFIAGGHDWETTEYGAIDIFATDSDIHNGPRCKRCGQGFCHHCNPECYAQLCPTQEPSR